MDKKAKVQRAKKRGPKREQVFEKTEADGLLEVERRRQEEQHLKTYGIRSFEDNEEPVEETKPLDTIREEHGSDSEAEEAPPETTTPPATQKAESPPQPPVEPPKPAPVGLLQAAPVDLDELKERIKTEDLGISEEMIEKVRRAREERERARVERELEQQKLKALAEKARLEFEEKQKAKDKFKPKKRK